MSPPDSQRGEVSRQPNINYVEYPVAPSQPMLSDRSNRTSGRNNNLNASQLPASLQSSPERDEIICFAPMQKSPPNDAGLKMLPLQTCSGEDGAGVASIDTSYFKETKERQ